MEVSGADRFELGRVMPRTVLIDFDRLRHLDRQFQPIWPALARRSIV